MKRADLTYAQLLELTQSADPEDRAWAAQNLKGRSAAGRAVLLRLLDDTDPDVRAMAAQSLALAGDVASLPRLIALLGSDDGRTVRPLAWAVAELAKRDPAERQAVQQALADLRGRGSSAVRKQVDLLTD
jgi:HEAT repeat protein